MSPPAKPVFAFLPDNLVGQFLNTYPESVTWFRQRGCRLDETCGQRTLAELLGPDSDSLLVDLALHLRLDAWDGDADACCGSMAIDELVDHLVDDHHAYTRAELGRLARIADHLRQRGDDAEWFDAFDRLRRHLLAHLAEEEEQLFPACRRLEGSIAGRPISSQACNHELVVMGHGHAEVERQLDTLLALLADHVGGPDDERALAAMQEGVRDLAQDLAVHSYKEDEYLLPAAIHADELFDRRRRARTGAEEDGHG